MVFQVPEASSMSYSSFVSLAPPIQPLFVPLGGVSYTTQGMFLSAAL